MRPLVVGARVAHSRVGRVAVGRVPRAGTPGPDDIARQNQHSRPLLGRQRARGNARESGPELHRQRGGDAWHEPPRVVPPAART